VTVPSASYVSRFGEGPEAVAPRLVATSPV
jgi:hypothetical protein